MTRKPVFQGKRHDVTDWWNPKSDEQGIGKEHPIAPGEHAFDIG